MSPWAVLAIVIIAILVNGVLATIEDDRPGGFSNPDGASTPRYLRVLPPIVRWLLGTLCFAVATFMTITALQRSDLADRIIVGGLAALSVAAAILMLKKRR